MTELLLPPGLKICFLTTIEDGEITQEIISDDKFFLSLDEIVAVSRQLGQPPFKTTFSEEVMDLAKRSESALRAIAWRMDKIANSSDTEEISFVCDVQEKVSDIRLRLKKLSSGE